MQKKPRAIGACVVPRPIQAILRTSSGELRLCEREPHRFYDALGFTISFRQSPDYNRLFTYPSSEVQA